MSMREKIARAMWAAYDEGAPPMVKGMPWHPGCVIGGMSTLGLAELALDALMEPTTSMIDAGMAEAGVDLRAEWLAMIAAAKAGA